MKQELLKEITEKTQRLIEAPTCSRETKEAACRWLEAAGTDREQEETKAYIEELEEDIMPIEKLIAFAGSDAGIEYFGKIKASEIAAHAKEIKAAGSKYCDCPACSIAEEILLKKEKMLGGE